MIIKQTDYRKNMGPILLEDSSCYKTRNVLVLPEGKPAHVYRIDDKSGFTPGLYKKNGKMVQRELLPKSAIGTDVEVVYVNSWAANCGPCVIVKYQDDEYWLGAYSFIPPIT